MTQPEADRTLRQLDNDVQSIYEMLADIQHTQTRHGNRLDEHSAKLDSLDTKMDALDTNVGSLDTKMDTVLELLRAR